MGLDIAYFRKLTPATVDDEDYNNHVKFGSSMEWSEKNWPGRGDPLNPDTVYSFAERGGFHAGSYGGYNSWRASLADIAQDGDFEELINFADNEGTIGPIVSAKLAADFAKNQARVDAVSDKDVGDAGWFRRCYANWRKAFETAADGGAVDFR